MNIKKQFLNGVCLFAFCIAFGQNAHAKRPWVEDKNACFANAQILNVSIADSGDMYFEASHTDQGRLIKKTYKNILGRSNHDLNSKILYISEGQKMLYLAMATGQEMRGWCDNKNAQNPEVWELQIDRG